MRNIFYLVALLTIFNASLTAQGGTTCTNITIFCPDEQNFLDSVETKLWQALANEVNSKNSYPLQDYDVVSNDGSNWYLPLTKTELKNLKLPYKYLPTYTYQLVINWNMTHDTGHLIGFSKEYCYQVTTFKYTHAKGTQFPGIYLTPFYHVPVAQYSSFLNAKEMDRLNTIIEKAFINYINVDTIQLHQCIPVDTSLICQSYSDTSDLSRQEIPISKINNFPIMPLPYWISIIKRWLNNYELLSYKNDRCDSPAMDGSEVRDIFTRIDTDMDQSGNRVAIPYEVAITSIGIGEKWNFMKDTSTNNGYSYPPPSSVKITRQTYSLGLITHIGYTLDKSLWIKYSDLDSLSRKEGFRYYQEQLDNILFDKLNAHYWYIEGL